MTTSIDYQWGELAIAVDVEGPADIGKIRMRIDNIRVPFARTTAERHISIKVRPLDNDWVLANFRDVARWRVDWRETVKSLYLQRSPDEYEILYDLSTTYEVDILRLVYHLVADHAESRGLVALHCSCVDFDGSAAIFTGSAHAGKSSLAVRLASVCPSASIVADDLVWLEPTTDGYVATTGFAYLKADLQGPLVGRELGVPEFTQEGEGVYALKDCGLSTAHTTTIQWSFLSRLVPGYEALLCEPLDRSSFRRGLDSPNTFFYRDYFQTRSRRHGWHQELETRLDEYAFADSHEVSLLIRGYATPIDVVAERVRNLVGA